MFIRVNGAALILAVTFSISPGNCQQSASPAIAQVGGSAQAQTGTTGPGRRVQKSDVRQSQREFAEMNKLDQGTANEEELRQISRRAAGQNPRKEIADFASSLSDRVGSQFLRTGQLIFKSDEATSQVFSKQLFYVLRFRQWPIGMNIPAPLQYNNIFAVHNGLTLLSDKNQLTKLFQKYVHDVKSNANAGSVAKAWLQLSQELAQDGMFQFSIAEPEITAEGGTIVATGKAIVDPKGGNMGEITARLTFDAAGDLTAVEESNTVKTGMRPICQSTKLLDFDPIVRKMAEQDLLIMGKSAKLYLEEQRLKSPPELQKAIDDVWRKILKENR